MNAAELKAEIAEDKKALAEMPAEGLAENIFSDIFPGFVYTREMAEGAIALKERVVAKMEAKATTR